MKTGIEQDKINDQNQRKKIKQQCNELKRKYKENEIKEIEDTY